MKKLKGLWLIGLGLFLLVLWDALVVWLAYAINEPPETPVITVLVGSFHEALVDIFTRFTIWSLWPITGLALIAIVVCFAWFVRCEKEESNNEKAQRTVVSWLRTLSLGCLGLLVLAVLLCHALLGEQKRTILSRFFCFL